jgi:hypothetical protein
MRSRTRSRGVSAPKVAEARGGVRGSTTIPGLVGVIRRDTTGTLITCVPTTDVAFTGAAKSLLAATPAISAMDLQAGLRLVYPGAVVRRRDISGEAGETWYAYRDGSFVPSADQSWADEPGTAWARFDPITAEILAENDALVELFAPVGGSLVGHFAREFIPEGADGISAAQLKAVQEVAESGSVGLARRGNGSLFFVEFVARPFPGGVEAWYREVATADRS